MSTNRLILASANKGKIKEITEMCRGLDVTVVSLEEAFGEKVDIPETGDTFEANALLKAEWVRERMLDAWVLADDSGLEVDALDGKPGVYSARFAGPKCIDSENIKKLLHELSGVADVNRGAQFVCTMVLVGPHDKKEVVRGECRGRIIHDPIGEHGFGYDPVFVPDGYSLTFAQIESSTKNTISHRSKALKQLRGSLERLF